MTPEGGLDQSLVHHRVGHFNEAGDVRAFADDVDAVLQQIRGVFAIDLVLGGARERALRLVIPKRIVIELRIRRRERRAFEFVRVF